MGRPKKNSEGDEENMSEDTVAEKVEETTEKSTKPAQKIGENKGFGAFKAAAQKKWAGNIGVASELNVKVPRISFGNVALDIATFGGLAQGRMCRLFGMPKSAKTGTALNAAAEVQNHCSVCMRREECNCDNRSPAGVLWVDAEGRSGDNLSWMLGHGFKHPDLLMIQQPPTGEQVVDLIDAAIRDESAGFGVIVLDSIANVVSSAEINKATEDGGVMGRNAMLINSAMRKWTSSLNARGISGKAKPTIILLNQIRNKLDGYGSPDVVPGGLGQGFATSLDIKFTKRAVHYLVDDGNGKFTDKAAGGGAKGFTPDEDAIPDYAEIEFKVVESSMCPKGRYGTFNYWLRNAHGRRVGDPDNVERLFAYGKNYNLFTKTKEGYVWKDLKEPTQEKLEAALAASPEMQKAVWNEIVERLSK